MQETFALSESAVAVLRFRVRGYQIKVTDRSLEAFRELAAAGIMEPVPGADGNPESRKDRHSVERHVSNRRPIARDYKDHRSYLPVVKSARTLLDPQIAVTAVMSLCALDLKVTAE